jgi:hypothetical protein
MLGLLGGNQHELVVGHADDADCYWITGECVQFDKEENTQNVISLKHILKGFKLDCRKPIFIEAKTIPKTISHLIKFLKLNLHSVEIQPDNKRINVGIENEGQESVVSSVILKMFNYQVDPILMSNREVEYFRITRDIHHAVLMNLDSTLGVYRKKIRVPDQMARPEKPGFELQIANALAMFTSELKRLGMQTGMLESVQLENLIYRTYPEDDLPSLQIGLPEKTKEKLALKSGQDNKA